MDDPTDDKIEIARLRARIQSLRTALFAVQSTRRRTSPEAAHRAMRKIAFEALESDDNDKDEGLVRSVDEALKRASAIADAVEACREGGIDLEDLENIVAHELEEYGKALATLPTTEQCGDARCVVSEA